MNHNLPSVSTETSISRRDHFESLEQKNVELLESTLEPEYFQGVLDRTSGPVERQAAFLAIERVLFGFPNSSPEYRVRTFAELLQIREHAEQYDKRVYDQLLSNEVAGIVQDFTTDQKVEEATDLVLQGVGVLLVRPEILHAKNEVLDFLADQQVNVLKTVDLKLDPKQYIGLYSHAFLDEQKEAHVRRRALGYIDSDLCAVVIRHQDQRLHSPDFMQFMVDTYKGVAGKADDQTLRGKIVHGLLADVRSDPAALRALDPLGIYSQLSHHNIYPDGVDPFLANLPGVHMPDSSEVIKDLCVLAGDKGIRERFL